MTVFFATLIALALCGLALGLGMLLGGAPLEAGCSGSAATRCADCPHRGERRACRRNGKNREPGA